MDDREKTIRLIEEEISVCASLNQSYRTIDLPTLCNILALLKKQEEVQQKIIPEELKQKMWNALYAEEDKIEERCIGTSEHENWFFIYRPWLQKGFNLAIKAIADWEGR